MNKPEIKLPPRPEPDGCLQITVAGHVVDVNAYRDSTMDAYACAAVELDRQGRGNAKQRYDKAMEGCEERDPIERLRFYCSLAMAGQDWLDVEPFFDAVIADRQGRGEPEIVEKLKLIERYLFNEVLKLEAAYGHNFKKDATNNAREAHEKLQQVILKLNAPQPAEPVKVLSDEDRGEVAVSIQARNRHTDLPTVRFWVDAVCNEIASYGQPAQPTASAAPVGKVRHFQYSGIARNGFSQEAVLNDDAPSLPDGALLYAAPVAAQPSVPDGWPTAEMVSAFANVFSVRDQKGTFAPAFRAALEAAPTTPAAEQAQQDADKVDTHPSYGADCCQGHAPEPECKCAKHDAARQQSGDKS